VSAAGAHYPTTTTTNNKSTSGTWCRKQYRVVRPVTSRRPAMARPQTPPLPDRGGSGASAAGPHGHRRHRRHPRPGGRELGATRTPLRMDCSANAPSARVKSTNNNKCACSARRHPQVDDHRRVITNNKTPPREFLHFLENVRSPQERRTRRQCRHVCGNGRPPPTPTGRVSTTLRHGATPRTMRRGRRNGISVRFRGWKCEANRCILHCPTQQATWQLLLGAAASPNSAADAHDFVRTD
jgi:hypothetical protein